MKKLDLYMENLGCANCANKMEEAIGKLEGVESVMINFLSGKMTLQVDEKVVLERDEEVFIENINTIATKIEIGVSIKRRESVREGLNRNDLNILLEESSLNINESESIEKAVELDEEKESFGQEHGSKIRLLVGVVIYLTAMFSDFGSTAKLLTFAAAYIVIGGDVVVNAFKNILNGNIFDENFLMSLATIGAFAIGEYPEAVAVMLFYKVGEYLEDMAVDRSRKSIEELMDIKPEYVNLVVEEGKETTVKAAPESIKVGDIILIKPGEKVPLDGVVLSGESMLDRRAITGESLPESTSTGRDIISGSINLNGLLTVEVTKPYSQSTVAKILDLVQNAAGKKAKTEKFITVFAKYYTPAVVGLAVLVAFVPPLIMGFEHLSQWVYRALIFLVVSCPCALVISIPIGFIGGIGLASKNGILVKGGNYLEALSGVDAVLFDKTGTLTKGNFQVSEIIPEKGYEENQILEMAAMAEIHSNHPIALSISEAFNLMRSERNIPELPEFQSYEEIRGKGVKVINEGEVILAGSKQLMSDNGINVKEDGGSQTCVYIASGGRLMGRIHISDEIRPDAKEAVKNLKDLGIKRIVMLTGDKKEVALDMAGKVNIEEVYWELLPGDKVTALEKISEEVKGSNPKAKVIFVGDGINDAPVLTLADIGIAMGGVGSDAAIEAADAVIMTDEPGKIPSAIKIAHITKSIVWQNIVFALGIKAGVIILSVFGLANMWEAVFADVGVACLAILNSARIVNRKI